MKILFLAPHLSTGGMPAFLLKRVESLLKYDRYNENEIFVVEYEYYGELFVVHRNKIKQLVQDKFYSLGENKMQLMEIIRTEGIDIVHIDEMPELMNNDRLFKDLYNNDRTWRIVETCHNSSFRPESDKRFYPDMYSFCTPWHEDVFADMDAKFITIPYPIEKVESLKQLSKVELGLDPNKKQVINVGLWTPGKNQGEGIEIARKYPDMMFHFIGNLAGNFQFYWQPLMEDLPINVKIWGERDDIDTFMQAADIFMFNSTLELNPLVLREAIAHELPIIARNLPQYAGMYDQYLNPIDTDLNTLKCTYKAPTEHTSLKFALLHNIAYEKIVKCPIHKQEIKVIQHFVDNPYLEIKGVSDSNFTTIFYDENNIAYYQESIKSNHWIKLNRQYYTKWKAKVWQDGELIYENVLNLENQRVYIAFESKSLGDTLAWIPYALEFKKKHNCHLIVSTFWNSLFNYPEIEFVEPTTEVKNIYALYRIGYFDDTDKLPHKQTSLPLQKVATDILGLDFKETKPILSYKPKVPKKGKYATIATNSTAGCKFWTKEGWQAVINWLVENGYEVYNTSKEPNPFDNCTQITTPSLESKMDWIAGSEFFIGLSSGLTWLAWAMGKKVIMISNFTEDWNEFDCYRVKNENVCHGCWNNPNFKFNPGDWLWCPVYKGTDKQFICHTSITPEMVIKQIKYAME
jgi:autotransporter strand-loop-strand O-heptosyltransferase